MYASHTLTVPRLSLLALLTALEPVGLYITLEENKMGWWKDLTKGVSAPFRASGNILDAAAIGTKSMALNSLDKTLHKCEERGPLSKESILLKEAIMIGKEIHFLIKE